MENITKLPNRIKEFLTETAKRVAISRGFIKRRRKLTGCSFVQALILGNLSDADCSMERMCQLLHEESVIISKQGLDFRFNDSAIDFMRSMYEESIGLFANSFKLDCGILQKFNNVKLLDSSNIKLPDSMEGLYKGHGSGFKNRERRAKASIKLQTLYNYSTQTISKIDILAGTRSDQGYKDYLQDINPNDLLIADLGYFVPKSFSSLGAKGAYFISRYKTDTNVYDRARNKLDLLELLEKVTFWQGDILLGKESLLPVRIVCHKLTKEQSDGRRRKANTLAKARGYKSSQRNQNLLDWSIFITNIPENQVSIKHIATIYRTRWQIELLFKLYKSHFKIESLKGKSDSSRVLCELYAKLCGIIIFHAISNCLISKINQEVSMTKAFLEFKRRVPELTLAFKKSINKLKNFFKNLRIAWANFCLKDKYRKTNKSTLSSLKLINIP